MQLCELKSQEQCFSGLHVCSFHHLINLLSSVTTITSRKEELVHSAQYGQEYFLRSYPCLFIFSEISWQRILFSVHHLLLDLSNCRAVHELGCIEQLLWLPSLIIPFIGVLIKPLITFPMPAVSSLEPQILQLLS